MLLFLPVLQTLKIIRYTTRLLLATALRDSGGGELAQRLKRFEGSIATSRCVWRSAGSGWVETGRSEVGAVGWGWGPGREDRVEMCKTVGLL